MSWSIIRTVHWMASTIALPFLCAGALVNSRWRFALPERLGLGAWQALRFAPDEIIWFHAASVGEVGGLTPLIRALKNESPDQKILCTTTSLTGQNKVREDGIADAALLLPFDHPRILRKVISRIRPRAVVITETELWPGFLGVLADLGIPVLLVNARISDYSFPHYKQIRAFIKPALMSFVGVLTQSPLDRERFIELGLAPEKAQVAGCTKFDQTMPSWSESEKEQLIRTFGLDPEKPIFIAGSIREKEDEIVIDAYLAARKSYPCLQAIIAPRHPERFEEVALLLAARGVSFNRKSKLPFSDSRTVLLLDTLGDLRACYAIGDFAFIGATLVNIGGHNPLEPAAYGKPAIVGPYTSNVRDIIASLRAANAIFEVQSGEELYGVISHATSNSVDTKAAGARAQQVFFQNLGATGRVLESLRPYVSSFASATDNRKVRNSDV